MSNIEYGVTRFSRFIGMKRLLLDECPRCNGDAPNVYDCKVCNNLSRVRPNYILKALWWLRFVTQFTKEQLAKDIQDAIDKGNSPGEPYSPQPEETL